MKMWTIGYVLAVAALMVGCGTDAPVAPEPTESARPPVTPEVPDPEEPAFEYPYIIESVDDLPIEANALTSITPRVRLRKTDGGQPVAGEELNVRLTHAPDETSSLTDSRVVTAPDGVATFELTLGSPTGSAIVMVSHADAAPFYLDITVGEPLTGSVRVQVIDPSGAPTSVAPYRIAFHDASQVQCDDLSPRTRHPDNDLQLYAVDSIPVTAEGFDGGTTWTVVADGMGTSVRTLGYGCTDGVRVEVGETTTTTVQLHLLPIVPSGTFLVDGLWNIRDAVAASNDTAGMLVGVIEFMANPGASLYDLVMTEIEDAVGFSIGVILDITGIQQQIIDYINGQLFQFAPIETFAAVSQDLADMLNQLEVQSRLTIHKTDDQYNFEGEEEWTALKVHWTWQCQQNQAPGCGEHIVDLEGADAGAASVSYGWSGYVDGYDQLVIESHQAQFDIGRLQLYLLEKVIIPDLTGGNATTVAGALSYWVDCPGLAAQAVAGNDICDPTGFFCLGESLITGACNAAMTQIANVVVDPLQNQPVLDLELSATATLLDEDANSMADHLVDGVTDGSVVPSGEPVSATWSATLESLVP